jgi:hypothetical protein
MLDSCRSGNRSTPFTACPLKVRGFDSTYNKLLIVNHAACYCQQKQSVGTYYPLLLLTP